MGTFFFAWFTMRYFNTKKKRKPYDTAKVMECYQSVKSLLVIIGLTALYYEYFPSYHRSSGHLTHESHSFKQWGAYLLTSNEHIFTTGTGWRQRNYPATSYLMYQMPEILLLFPGLLAFSVVATTRRKVQDDFLEKVLSVLFEETVYATETFVYKQHNLQTQVEELAELRWFLFTGKQSQLP